MVPRHRAEPLDKGHARRREVRLIADVLNNLREFSFDLRRLGDRSLYCCTP